MTMPVAKSGQLVPFHTFFRGRELYDIKILNPCVRGRWPRPRLSELAATRLPTDSQSAVTHLFCVMQGSRVTMRSLFRRNTSPSVHGQSRGEDEARPRSKIRSSCAGPKLHWLQKSRSCRRRRAILSLSFPRSPSFPLDNSENSFGGTSASWEPCSSMSSPTATAHVPSKGDSTDLSPAVATPPQATASALPETPSGRSHSPTWHRAAVR